MNVADFQQSISKHNLLGLALKWTRAPADAKDLVQDTLVKAFIAWPNFTPNLTLSPDISVKNWLFEIMRNTWLHELRDRKLHARLDDVYMQNREWAYDLLPTVVSPTITTAIDALPDRQRQVVERVCIAGEMYREAAETMSIPMGSVMSGLFRAREKLAEALRPIAEAYGLKIDVSTTKKKQERKPQRQTKADLVTDEDRVQAAMTMSLEPPL